MADRNRLIRDRTLPRGPDVGGADNLKAKTIRGGAARTGALVANFLLRICSVMVLSRLLGPEDFGLIAMVTVFTGFLNMLRDFGLAAATVQSDTVTEQQACTLFWINLLAGGVLTVVSVAASPLLGLFYHEPRLVWITSFMAVAFLFNGAGVQHWARLQREMRFTALALIDVVALIASNLIAVLLALAGFGYWSLVAMAVSNPLIITIAAWSASGWIPGMPPSFVSVRSMLRFGATLTLNGMVLQAAFHVDKLLLGRFWGADPTGMYMRAYQLTKIPIDGMNWAVGEVAFSALSRIQSDVARFRRYFLRGYSLVLAVTVPVTIACCLFSADLVYVFLGAKWKGAGEIVRRLAPSILVFAIANPLGWLMSALGLAKRSLAISLVLAPLMIAGYVLGLRGGPNGVALAYSVVMIAWIAPVGAWAVHGTPVSFRDMVIQVTRPLASVLASAIVVFAVRRQYAPTLTPWPRLILDCAVLFTVYFAILLFATDQKAVFLDLIRGWRYKTAEQRTVA